MLILVVDDESGVRNTLNELLKKDHDVILCDNGESALKEIEKSSIDLVITDFNMPKLSGLELIAQGKKISASTSFLMITAFGTVDQAVDAIKLGADDYFLKPFELTEIEHRIRRIEKLRAWKVQTILKESQALGCTRLLGNSTSILAAKEFVTKVASVTSPVLLFGPTGSGKEVLAKAIHESGMRKDRAFIAINCASLNEQLMESELFGHEKGSFTGATTVKLGKFELAHGGIIFFDEIGELSPSIQAKLLRVLQEKEFCRVGGVRQIKTDARVIAATHRPLRDMIKTGAFREDLYFRLNVLSFELAPLEQRHEDIPLLIETFWIQFCKEFAKSVVLSAEVKSLLSSYHFPGNVRELRNVLERLIVLGPNQGEILPQMLPDEIRSKVVNHIPDTTHDGGLDKIIEEMESTLIEKAMTDAHQNQVKAAAMLKISRGTLQYKLKKYRLPNAS